MKKLIILTLIINCSLLILNAQNPKAFKYQAIARDNAGEALKNTSLSVMIEIVDELHFGNTVYKETHSVITNDYGLFNLQIGWGADKVGDLASLNWYYMQYYIKISIKKPSDVMYTWMGTSELLSVPYSFYSDNSGMSYNLNMGTWGQTLRCNGTGVEPSSLLYNDGMRIGIGTTKPQSLLDIRDTVTLPWGYKFQIYDETFAKPKKPFLSQGWDGLFGDFTYFGVTGNRSNTKESAILMTQHYGILLGRGSDETNHLRKLWMRVDTNGRVGLGTYYPQYNFDLYNDYNTEMGITSGYTNVGIILNRKTATANSHIKFILKDDTEWDLGTFAGNSDFVIRSADVSKYPFMINAITNNIGIGTNNPDYRLSVDVDNTTSTDGIQIRRKLSSQNTGIKIIYDPDQGRHHFIVDNPPNHDLLLQSWKIVFCSDVSLFANKMYYSLNGYFGIGTMAPTERLTVANGNINLTNSDKGIILNGIDKPLITRGYDQFTSGDYQGLGRWGLFKEGMCLAMGMPALPNEYLRFRSYNANSTVANELMSIDQGGNVSIPGSVAAGAANFSGNVSILGSISAANINTTGTVSASNYSYSTPALHYLYIPAESFQAGRSIWDYVNDYNSHGAYITNTGTSAIMVAPVILPAGATITRIIVYFYDNSTYNLTMYLLRESVSDDTYGLLGTVTSSGISGFGSNYVDISHVVQGYNYSLAAWASPWDGANLRIKSVVIRYTVNNPD